MPKPTVISELFVAEMNAQHAIGEKGKNYRGFGVVGGRTYDKVLNVETSYNSTEETGGSVHAFINRANGDLIKAATWSSPQKNVDGTPAVRFHLDSEASMKAVVAKADRHGGYLYK